MSKIGIIVPIYNVENFLDRCINSIILQTYTDFTLILVNDGSPDNCPQICDEYANQDSRIVVIHQENKGLSAARNAGIEWLFHNSECEWITFIDSDDWIHPEYLQKLLESAEKYNVPISICGFEQTHGAPPSVTSQDLEPILYNTEEFYVKHNVNANIAGGKLYKKECFLHIRYPLGKLHEDEFTTYKILFSTQYVAVIHAPLYAYFINPKSIMHSTWTPRRMDALDAYTERLVYFKK